MANYGTKYRLDWQSRTAPCRVDLQKDGYSSGVQNLTPATAPLTIRWGEPERPDLTRALMQSEATIRFRGDSTGEAVSEVFDAPDRAWRVVFQRDTGAGLEDEWYGFLKTDEWRDNQRRDSDIVELAAIGGLQLLQNVDYDLAGTDVYSALRTIMRGVHPLNIAANCQWYPYRGGNQIAASSLPLSNLTIGGQAFDELEKIEGEEGFETTGRRSRHRALEAILERFGMRAFQSRGEWVARQRTQIQPNGEIKEWPDSTAVANNNPTTRDLTRSLPTPFQTDQPRGLVRRLRTAESRHEYSQLGELVANGSFENGGGSLQNWAGSASVRDYSNVSALSKTPTQEDSFVAEVDQGEKVEQDVPAIIHDPGPRSAIQFSFELYLDGVPSDDPFQETRIRLGDYFVQQRTEITDEPVDPTSEDDGRVPLAAPIVGDPDTIVIPRGAELITGGGATITLSEPARGGDEVLRGSVSAALSSPEAVQYYVWSDSAQEVANGTDRFGLFTTTHYPQDVASSGDDPGTVIPNTISLPLNTPTGNRIAEKDLRFAHESFGGFAGSYRSFIDNISAKLVRGGEPIGETSFIALDEQEGEEVELTQIIGDGPTFDHPRALQLSGAPVTRNWKVGAYSSTDARSGQLIEEITAEAAHRQQRETAQRFTENVPLVQGDEVWPHDVFSINGALYSVTFLERTFSQEEAVQAELTELKDAGTSGLTRTFEMNTSEGGGGGGGLVSGTDGGGGGGASTWDGLSDKPFVLTSPGFNAGDFPSAEQLASADITDALVLGNSVLRVNPNFTPDELQVKAGRSVIAGPREDDFDSTDFNQEDFSTDSQPALEVDESFRFNWTQRHIWERGTGEDAHIIRNTTYGDELILGVDPQDRFRLQLYENSKDRPRSFVQADPRNLDVTYTGYRKYVPGFTGQGIKLTDNAERKPDFLEVSHGSFRGTLRVREFIVSQTTVEAGPHAVSPGGGKVAEFQSSSHTSVSNTFSNTTQQEWEFENSDGESDRHGLAAGDRVLAQRFDPSSQTVIAQIRAVVDEVVNPHVVRVTVNSDFTVPKTGQDTEGYSVFVVGSSDSGRNSLIFDNPYGPKREILDGISDFTDWDNRGEKLRFIHGNLQGRYDYSTDAYGMAAGPKSGEYIAADSVKGVRIVDNTGGNNTARAQLQGSTLTLGDTADPHIQLDPNQGGVKVFNSNGDAVIQLDNTGDAFIQDQLTMGANGVITNTTTDYKIDKDGITIEQSSGFKEQNAITFFDSGFSNRASQIFSSGGVGGRTIIEANNPNGVSHDIKIETTPGEFKTKTDGVELDVGGASEIDRMEFQKVNSGVTQIFKNPMPDDPSNNELETVMGPEEVILYSAFSSGNLQLRASKTDSTGSIKSTVIVAFL